LTSLIKVLLVLLGFPKKVKITGIDYRFVDRKYNFLATPTQAIIFPNASYIKGAKILAPLA
jgi:hypothetical protein